MNPTVLSSYLRVILVYAIGAASALGAGYEIIHTGGNFTSPIVGVAAAWNGAILGVHINNIGSPDPTVTTDPTPPVVLTDQPVTPPAPPTPVA